MRSLDQLRCRALGPGDQSERSRPKDFPSLSQFDLCLVCAVVHFFHHHPSPSIRRLCGGYKEAMESCYVPNNPNFASTAASSAAVDQWTPPSPTSPPVSAPDSSKQVEQHVYHHDSVIQQLCCDSSDLIVVNTAVSASSANDPSGASQHHHTLTSLSALPPVQVTHS